MPVEADKFANDAGVVCVVARLGVGAGVGVVAEIGVLLGVAVAVGAGVAELSVAAGVVVALFGRTAAGVPAVWFTAFGLLVKSAAAVWLMAGDGTELFMWVV